MAKHVGFSLPDNEYEAWKAYAHAQERSLASMIRLEVNTAVQEWKLEVKTQKEYVSHLEEL